MKILVTSGATREPIDGVRFLSNVSTGRTGALLADALARHGHAVTLLHGEGAVAARTLPAEALHTFSSTENLQAHLRRLLGTGGYESIVHCAAVSDYRPAETSTGKLSSYAGELVLRLVPTPKLLPELKQYAPRPLTVIGFKLTAGAAEAERTTAVARLFAAGTVDAVIHNDLDDLATGDARPFRAYLAPGPSATQPYAFALLTGLTALSAWLHERLQSPGSQP